MFNIGGIIGALGLAFAADRIGALRVLPVGYTATAVIVLAIARANDPTLAFLPTALGGAGIAGSQFCFNALVASYYPTAVRTTGLGWALGVGRVGSILGPLIGGMALASGATMADIFSGAASKLGRLHSVAGCDGRYFRIAATINCGSWISNGILPSDHHPLCLWPM